MDFNTSVTGIRVGSIEQFKFTPNQCQESGLNRRMLRYQLVDVQRQSLTEEFRNLCAEILRAFVA